MDFQFTSDAAIRRPKVFDDYDFNDNVRIGRGSYGQVYKAREKKSNDNRFYALKEVELSAYSPSTCREIALYREIKHANIMDLLRVYFSYSAQKAWLLFDYAEYDLHSMIKFYRTADSLNLAEVIQIQMPESLKKSCMYQILNGIKYLHDNWILHRDLKPENILVMGDGPERGCIKITDLGMARTFHSPLKPLGEVDVVVVTSWYRAPELLLGARHYTKAIDIFSIGCIFAELLTYVPIFSCSPEQAPQPIRSPYQLNQLDKLFSVLGYPTLTTWTELRYVPEYGKMQKDFARSKYNGCSLTKYMKTYDIGQKEPAFQLLTKMLTMDPKKRPSSEDALNHEYFQQKPLPTADVFNCYESFIPFPHRQYLTKTDKPAPSKMAQKAKTLRKTHLQERNYQC